MGKCLTIVWQPLKRGNVADEVRVERLSLNQGYGKRLSGRLLYLRVVKSVDHTIEEANPAE